MRCCLPWLEKIPRPYLRASPGHKGRGATQTFQDKTRWENSAGVWIVADDTIAGREGEQNSGEA